MSYQATLEPTYHALLIGVDNYTSKPLDGCVNDIDAVQRLLLDRAKIPAKQITRLASPHPGTVHETTVQEAPATLENIRAALAELGSERVAPNDHVFIYYAGHGARQVATEGTQTFHCESLLPVDFNATPSGWEVLYDFELNELIAGITARTRAVTFILDCCHSTGATRDVPTSSGMTSRFIDFERDLGRKGPVKISPALARRAGASGRGVTGGIAESVDACHVVAACLNHEIANEAVGPDGVRHGLLTRALIDALGGIAPEEMRTVPWGRVWYKLREHVERENPAQHPWMSGNVARAVLAGPPADGDVGFGVARTGANAYRIDAGTLAGITLDARLAVYGDKPVKFPPLGSVEDQRARSSQVLLKVTAATRSTAMAEAEGAPFDLPAGARGRLVEAGAPERLPCAVLPENTTLSTALAESPLLRVVPERDAFVRLEHRADGRWELTDDVHGAREGYPVLFSLGPEQLDRARAVLEHYLRYALPIRMATLCTDLPGALQVRLLASPQLGAISPEEAQRANLPEVPIRTEFPYELAPGETFCIRVHNTSSERLRVTLVNCAASGKVEWLGDQIIDAKARHVFWMDTELGNPFETSLPEGATQCIDRLVAIGRSAVGTDIRYLEVDTRFADVAYPAASVREMAGKRASSPPAEKWTATETIVRTRL